MDQLSLSAWLPATMLVGVMSLLAQIHGGQVFDVGAAVAKLAHQPLGILLVIAFALILTTMITQAFAYESIRIFEGYWGRGNLVDVIAQARIKRHRNRKVRLREQADQLEKLAFNHARQRMLRDHVERTLIDILELQVFDAPDRDFGPYSEEKQREATSMGWLPSAPPEILRRRGSALQRLDSYPADHRLLPTMLGNTLRAHEDQMRRADGGSLEGFVMRNYGRVPPELMLRHNQSRTRLDMYCSLIFVFAVLAISAPVFLWKFGPAHMPAVVGVATFMALSLVSYAAAVSSARAYGSVLLAIDSYVTVALRKPPSPSES